MWFLRIRLSKDRIAAVWQRLVLITMALMLFVASIYPAAIVSDGNHGVFLVAALIATAFYPVVLFVHEIGHAVAAWSVGWSVHLIVVGPRAFAPRRKKFFRIPEQYLREDVGGWVHATPPQDTAWNRGAVIVKSGGAAGNFVLSVLSLMLSLMIYRFNFYLHTFFVGLSGASAVYGFINLVPTSREGGWVSDGASLIKVLRGEVPTIRQQCLARLFGLVHDGVPVENWDVSILNELIDGSPSEQRAVDPLLIGYAFVMGDLVAARFLLERYLKSTPDASFRHRCMYAFATAVLDRDAQHASRILEDSPSVSETDTFCYWRTQAAIAHLLGNREDSLEAVRNARHFADDTGIQPDEDDEALFGAIQQGRDLPRFEPRQRLSLNVDALPEMSAS